MADFYCPVELESPTLTLEQRWWFLLVDAQDMCDAIIRSRPQIVAVMGGTYGYSRWAPVRECPTPAYMQAMSDGMRKSRGKSPKARMASIARELAQVSA